MQKKKMFLFILYIESIHNTDNHQSDTNTQF